jgi:hypothetical protein
MVSCSYTPLGEYVYIEVIQMSTDFIKDNRYSRCRCCDGRFYPQWKEERGEFEDMCGKCLGKSFYQGVWDEDKNDINTHIESREQEIEDNRLGDLYLEDEYAKCYRDGVER